MEEIKAANGAQPQNCGWSTWSLICGILSFLCLPVIPAIIFGIIALVKINAGKGLLVGKGKAIAGIILGGLWLVLIPFLLIIAMAIPSLLTSRSSAREKYKTGLMEELKSKQMGGDKSSSEMADLFPPEPPAALNLMSSRASANEISAVSSLKTIAKAEALWYQQDADGNGIKDYWTYDVSGLCRMLRADGLTKCEFISIDLANADASPAEVDIFGNNKLSFRLNTAIMPKYGYLFEAMTWDENNEPYNQETVNDIPATNRTKFAFVAYPKTYGSTGSKTFIINESGAAYEVDPGSDQNKIILQWPGIDPSEVAGPSGKKWAIVPD